jgi:hypothetical protein
MNKEKITQRLNKIKFKAIKHSPELLMTAGVIGIVGATIMVCKATLKLNDVLEKRNDTYEKIQETINDETVEYTKEDAKKDITIVYASTALDIAKLYIPAVIVGGISIAAMIKSHDILNRRNAALAAAFATASESFSKYRKAVVDKYGDRVDYELRHGIKAEKISVTDENGKTKKETVDVVQNELDTISDYARYYDESCSGWTNDPEYNLMFLKAQQQYANDKLIAQGYLFLNDVYDMLGIPRSKAGQIVGWVYDPKNPMGDNYVDFGMYDVKVAGYRNEFTNDSINEERKDFINGYRPSILLDFNVDGNVWDRM